MFSLFASVQKVWYLLVLGLVCCGATQSADPCTFTKGSFYSVQQLLTCYRSVPFDDEVRSTTIQSLQASAQIYTFLDISNQSPDPNLPMQVNLLDDLMSLFQRNYLYDYEFHGDVHTLYNPLYDAHTQYYAPTCYQNFLLRQPFGPITFADASKRQGQKIYVSPFFPSDLVLYYKQTSGIDITSYAGAQIVSIDNQEALDYLQQFSNKSIGDCKDSSTRFNTAMTMPIPRPDMSSAYLGRFQLSTGLPLPSKPAVEYLFLMPDGTTSRMTFEWTVMALKTYTTRSFLNDLFDPTATQPYRELKSNVKFSDLKANQAQGKILKELPIHRKVTADDIIRRDSYLRTLSNDIEQGFVSAEPIPFSQRLQHFSSFASQAQTFTPLATSDNLSFWQLADNRTMVMYLDTFAPNPLVFYPVMQKGFEAAAEKKLDQLIIDLTNNGGGSICLGRSFIAYLQASLGIPLDENQNWGPEDIPLSPLATQMIQNAVTYNVETTPWSPGFYDDQNNVPVANNNDSVLLPGVPHVRGGFLRQYSRLVHINDCGDYGYTIETKQQYTASKIIILTNGFCGSMCAYFSNHIVNYEGVKVAVTGGTIDRKPMQYSAFPGGQVLDDPYIFSILEDLKFNTTCCTTPDDIVPRRLLTTAAYRYNIREVYPNQPPQYSTSPIEFVFQEADYHLYYNNMNEAIYPYLMWYRTLEYF